MENLGPIREAQILKMLREFDQAKPDIFEQVVENDQLVIRQTFSASDDYLKSTFPRTVLSLEVEANGKIINLIKEAPEGVRFQTYGGEKSLSKFSPGLPIAESGGGEAIFYNPAIFNHCGGVLMILHEIGHTWQWVEGRFKTKGDERRSLMYQIFLIETSPQEASTSKIKRYLKQIEAVENDAWQFAFNKHKDYQQVGMDLAPQVNLDDFCQYWLNWYNYDFRKALKVVGQEYRLTWKPQGK